MTHRRVGLVLLVTAAGCVFGPKPMIPIEETDAGGGLANMGADSGRTNAGDAAIGVPTADAGAGLFDAAGSSDIPPGSTDFDCHPRGDGGYFDDAGNRCDPTAGAGDGGAQEAPDASCGADAAGDAEARSDGAAGDGPAARCDGGIGAGVVGGPR